MSFRFYFLLTAACVAACFTSARAESVRFRMEAIDSSGTAIDSLTVGEEFILNTYTQHVAQPSPQGVFAAYLDISFDNNLASLANESIEFGPEYLNGTDGDLSAAGLFDNVGGFAGVSPVGPDELLVFSVPMQANNVGKLEFVGASAANSPRHDVLIFGESLATDVGEIDFGSLSLAINPVPEPSAARLGAIALVILPFWRRRTRIPL